MPFERQVLLLLVGYHVSPSVQRTFATASASSFGSDMGSAINVRRLPFHSLGHTPAEPDDSCASHLQMSHS